MKQIKNFAVCADGATREFIPFTFVEDQVGKCEWLPSDPEQAAAWQHICCSELSQMPNMAPGSVVIDNQRIAGFREVGTNKFIPY
jgi:hypothetical protein